MGTCWKTCNYWDFFEFVVVCQNWGSSYLWYRVKNISVCGCLHVSFERALVCLWIWQAPHIFCLMQQRSMRTVIIRPRIGFHPLTAGIREINSHSWTLCGLFCETWQWALCLSLSENLTFEHYRVALVNTLISRLWWKKWLCGILFFCFYSRKLSTPTMDRPHWHLKGCFCLFWFSFLRRHN